MKKGRTWMQSANHDKHNRKKKTDHMIWLTAFLLTVMVIATVSVVGSCLYSYAHQSDCQISLYDGQMDEDAGRMNHAAYQKKVAADPVIQSQAVQYSGAQAKEQAQKSAFEVDDATQVWKTETAIELFKTEYSNKNGAVTVKSADGRKVIAPGTEGSYTFSLKNTSNSAADYKIWVEAKLSSNMTGVLLQTRMSGDNGWLLGSKNSWETAEALDGVATAQTIGAGKTAEYTIDWQWPYEQGEDVSDTGLGNASISQDMSYTVTIYTLTAADGDAQKDQNALQHFLGGARTGDRTRILLWVVVWAVSAGILLYLFILKRRKNDGKNEHYKSE